KTSFIKRLIMKNIFAICAALCVVLGCISCSSPPELPQPSGEWIDVNPESVLLPGEKNVI
ncbi:TPA: hypothetical protein ACHY2X_005165, partial [Escherichia coli]